MNKKIKVEPSYEAKWIEADAILNGISRVLDGERVSDFELSYSIVRRVANMRHELMWLRRIAQWMKRE